MIVTKGQESSDSILSINQKYNKEKQSTMEDWKAKLL